jgi:hypothetical protein
MYMGWQEVLITCLAVIILVYSKKNPKIIKQINMLIDLIKRKKI